MTGGDALKTYVQLPISLVACSLIEVSILVIETLVGFSIYVQLLNV